MIYVMGDLHGCYEEYAMMLTKLDFGPSDLLYVLGDVVDRGPEPIALLRDMACRANVYPVLGNHEYMALSILKRLSVGAGVDTLPEKYRGRLKSWLSEGGDTTLRGYLALTPDEREDVLDYLGDFALYEEITAGGQGYVLTHGGIEGFEPEKELGEYHARDFISGVPDYEKVYFPEKTLVSSHSPTGTKGRDVGRAFRANGHLGVDCGLVYGGRLCAVCLDDGREYYISKL